MQRFIMGSWYMCILLRKVLFNQRPSVLQAGIQISFYPVLCNIALLCPVSLLTIFGMCCIPCLLLLLLSSKTDMGVTLDVEGEGDENVADDGGDDADKGRPFSQFGASITVNKDE